MKIILSVFAFFLVIVIFSSCLGQANPVFIPIPDSRFNQPLKTFEIDVRNIIETEDRTAVDFLPEWLNVFLNGGIEAIERLNSFNGKYVFIEINEGDNFSVLNRWAQFFSSTQNFPILTASRIERKMISAAFFYPDHEYGEFFERLVKNAHNAVYPGAVKEDTYWVKIKTDNEDSASEMYVFFVLYSIDKFIMQNIINNMMTQTINVVTPTNTQAAAINRLRLNFFEGF